MRPYIWEGRGKREEGDGKGEVIILQTTWQRNAGWLFENSIINIRKVKIKLLLYSSM